MTQEIFNAKWQDDVVALAIPNNEISLRQGETKTLEVYAVFGNGMPSVLKDNSNFTFAVETTPAPTNSNVEVGANTGVITTTSATAGNCVISATLTGYDNISPALAVVTTTVE